MKILTLITIAAVATTFGCETPDDESSAEARGAVQTTGDDDGEEDDEQRSGQTAPGESGEQQPGPQPPAGDQQPDEPPPTAAPLWSREGLDAQPRMQQLRERSPHNPQTTDWQDFDTELPGRLTDSDAERAPTSPGAVLNALSGHLQLDAALGDEVWEQTRRLIREEPDRAVGVILQWGFKDDAMQGRDLQVTTSRDGDTWQIDELKERFHCARGATDDGLCI